MVLTSVAIPPMAVGHRLRGEWRWRRGAPAWPPPALPRRPRAILFDRDGTLVHDVPYNGDPSKVDPVDDAAEAVAAARAAGLAVGLISNQSGVARGLITLADVHGVNAELERAVGRFDTRQICPHAPDDGCACRKPAPGMVLAAARELGVRAQDCVVIGDIGADVDAARAAGAAAVLVPTAVTRDEEVAAAPVVASTLLDAVRLVVRR